MRPFLYRQHINGIKDRLMQEPFAVYDEMRQHVPQCTMSDYQLAHRECVYFFQKSSRQRRIQREL